MHPYTVVYAESLIEFTKTSSVLMIPMSIWQEKMLKALIWFEANFSVHISGFACAGDPERFAGGGPTMTIDVFFLFFCFLLDKGRKDPNTTISGPLSARQRIAGVPMLA